MRNYIYLAAFNLLLPLLLVTSCSHKMPDSNMTVVHVPSGLHSFPFLKAAETLKTYTVLTYTSFDEEVSANIENEKKSLFIMPTHTVAKLYNNDRSIVLVAVLTSGMAYIISSSIENRNIDQLNNSPIIVKNNGSTADILLRAVLGEHNVTYISEYAPIKTILEKINKKGTTFTALLEPEATAATIQSGQVTLHKIFNLQSQWRAVHPETFGLPHLCLAAHIDYVENNTESLTNLINTMKESSNWINTNLECASALAIEKKLTNISPENLPGILSSMNFICTTSKEAQKDIETYLSAIKKHAPFSIDNALPDSGFYAF